MGKIKSQWFFDDVKLCDFLNEIQAKGHALEGSFIKIVQGFGDGVTLFYDEDLEKESDGYL